MDCHRSRALDRSRVVHMFLLLKAKASQEKKQPNMSFILQCRLVEQEMFFQTSNWGRARTNVNFLAACMCIVQYPFQTSGLLNSILLNFHPEPMQRFSSVQQLPQHAHCQVLCRKKPKQNSSRGLEKNNNVPMGEGNVFNLPGFFLNERILAYVLQNQAGLLKAKQNRYSCKGCICLTFF